ncbi:MAG: prepilin-type N-terminal cleavage/methylation domain-containing protein [Pseudomonadales bacterium]|nr:prepilin-type N-terminal cleavage/methylation domain-containing protein [Pseudomonadales bacterium]
MGRLDGFTMLELLIALLIIGVLLGVALPDFEQTISQKRSEQTLKTLTQTIEFARIAAITSSSTVTLCKSSDGEACGGEWNNGVLVFTDSNRNRSIDDEDELLRYVSFHFARGQLRWRAFQNKPYLQMTSQGFTYYQNGNFTYCPNGNDPESIHQIIVNRLGRIRWATDSDGDGIREDSRGRPLNCDS